MDNRELSELLMRHLAARRLDARVVADALDALVAHPDAPPPALAPLALALEEEPTRFSALAKHVAQLRLDLARDAHRLRASDAELGPGLTADLADLPHAGPVGWATRAEACVRARRALELWRDLRYLHGQEVRGLDIEGVVERELAHVLEALARAPAKPWSAQALDAMARRLEDRAPEPLAAPLAALRATVEAEAVAAGSAAQDVVADGPGFAPPTSADVPALLAGVAARAAASDEALTTRRAWLDRLLAWPSDAAADHILEVCRSPWAQERAALVLLLRHGGVRTWAERRMWLIELQRTARAQAESLFPRPAELLLLWCRVERRADSAFVAALEAHCAEHVPPTDVEDFVRRWHRALDPSEANLLRGIPLTAASEVPTLTAAPPRARPTVPQPAPPRPVAPAAPPPTPAWQEHLHGFMSENGYLIAGILMVLAGCSLLAYFTWDRHWLLRYTIMPALLGASTWALAGLGRVLERRDPQLASTGAALRGAAIALLPANFMTVALLAGDPAVTGAAKITAIVVMSALYAAAFGASLVRWCRAVHPALGLPLGGTILALCALVMIGPVAREVAGVGTNALRLVLGVGFYVGFGLVAWCVTWFARRVLTPELAGGERVPAFVVATLGITFAEVFAWVHGWARTLPHIHTYAVLVVGAGGLVLLLERRLLELRARSTAHDKESYLGYALVLGGALMGLGEPTLRPIALAAAGLAWLRQSVSKRDAIHDAIGLTLCIAAGATIGHAPGVPPMVRPWIWLALAAMAMLLAAPARRTRWPSLAQAAAGFMPVLALATVASATTEQWRHGGPPIATAIALLQLAVVLAIRARDEDEPAYVDTATLVAAMALPYLGCVDIEHRTLQGNTMAFGLTTLGVLWLALSTWGGAILRKSRSTGLWLYGMLAVAAMVMRVVFEQSAATPTPWQMFQDYAGPLAMTALLVVATYTSRSLVPAAMAVMIAVILFPELKARFNAAFENLGWGSGLGSAATALGLLVSCFALRSWRGLRDLGEGDLYLGYRRFPLRRHDHTLFTWPIFAAAVFLIARTDTATLARHLWSGGVGSGTALALALTGVGWWMVAVYHRTIPGALAAAHLGWVWLAVGAAFYVASPGGRAALGLTERSVAWTWHHSAIAAAGSIQIAYWSFLAFARRRVWATELLARPARQALAGGAACLAAALVLELALPSGARGWPLVVLVGAQLAWLAIATGNEAYGSLFAALGWMALSSATAAAGTTPQIWNIAPGYALTAQLAMVLVGPLRARLQGLYRPLALVAALWCLVPAGALIEPLVRAGDGLPPRAQIAAMAAAALLTGWANRFGPAVLLAGLLAHLAVCTPHLTGVPPEARAAVLGAPWRLGLLAAALGLAGALLRVARMRGLKWIHGPAPLAPRGLSYGPWLQLPAAAIAVAAGVLHTAVPAWRDAPLQLVGPAAGALAMGILAAGWRQSGWLPAMIWLLALANVHAARIWGSAWFEAHGLTLGHLIGAGLTVTLFEGNALRGLLAARSPRVVLRHCGIWLAGSMVAVAWVNYAVAPDLSAIRWERFAASGAMIWLAGLYFRAVARRPEEADGVSVAAFEGLYHATLALALACFTLAVFPFARHPNTALAALVLPTLWFHARCELARGADLRARYRSSTSTLAFLILALYAAYGLVQLAFFPGRAVTTTPYHTSSPLVLIVALSMLRLHRLGGTSWLAFYAGLALMCGSYFALTSLPGCSPFDYPLAGAWCALAVAHAWTVVTDERSPVRTALLRLGGIDPATWLDLRLRLGPCQLVLAHLAVAWGLIHHHGATAEATWLLAATSTLLFHHGYRRQRAAYLTLGILELLAAAHAGFVVPDGPIPPDLVVGAVLALWAALLGLHRVALARVWLPAIGAHSLAFAAIAFTHVMGRHTPWSPIGLLAVAGIGLLGLLVPRRDRTATSPDQLAWAQLPILLPAWLAYFAVVPGATFGLKAALDPHAWLAVAFALLATGVCALAWHRRLYGVYAQLERWPPRLVDHTLSWLGHGGHSVFTVALVGASVLTGVVHLAHGAQPLSPGLAVPVLLLYLGCIAGWAHEARVRNPLVPITMIQLGAAGALTALRAQAILLVGHWDPVYDVWALLVIAMGLSAAMQALERRSPAVRLPFAVTYYVLPIASIGWCLGQGVSTDMVLLVLGLHAMMFGFTSRGRRDSPHTYFGLLGAVAFVTVGFYAKLELTVVHAYTIPVGVAVLALVQLFADKTERETRDGVRLVTLIGMMGPSAWYVLTDPRYPIAFHLVLLALSLVLAGVGSLLRIRVFVAVGIIGLLTDTGTIVVKSLLEVEHGLRMSLLGGLVLAVGAALVGGAVYVKTHRDAVSTWLAAIRARLGAWD